MRLLLTPSQTNMEPKNDDSQKESPLPGVHYIWFYLGHGPLTVTVANEGLGRDSLLKI